MKLRPPAIPLITIDPYISVWSQTDKLNESSAKHWTGRDFTLNGYVTVDGKEYVFLGCPEGVEKAPQVDFDYSAMSSFYSFKIDDVDLKVIFTSPLLIDDLYYLSRPVSYVYAFYDSETKHDISIRLELSEEFCLNKKGQYDVTIDASNAGELNYAKIGSVTQNVLNCSGDDIRIDWGYAYLGAKDSIIKSYKTDMSYISAECKLDDSALFVIGYDDIASIDYFGKHLKSYWNNSGETIIEALVKAYDEYDELFDMCECFSDQLYCDATKSGGEKYAELLLLAYRQVLAAHKLAIDDNGDVLYISKECFSNGCAATVDVSYPSIPLFLLYNPELVWGMMRPIYKYASTDEWKYDFAPHDAGQYPLVTGQVYGGKGNPKFESQMPVEECGNMLIMEASSAIACDDFSFAQSHFDTLKQWVKYLIQYGEDPENQLCTDDFAGHLAHNCNLSLKAIMGVAAFAIICDRLGDHSAYVEHIQKAREMALSWVERAKNDDGSYRLAFDKPNSFSMKYNAVWDKLFGLDIFPKGCFNAEIASNFKHMNPYGMPLDNRETYTKSDWLVWTATMAQTDDEFKAYINPLWMAFHYTPTRVPMTDWYYTITSLPRSYDSSENIVKCFKHRTVQGGLFIKLLAESEIVKYKN